MNSTTKPGVAAALLLTLLAAPATAQDTRRPGLTDAAAGPALREVLDEPSVVSLAVATDSALDAITVRPDIAFASQRLQARAVVRPWKQRSGANPSVQPVAPIGTADLANVQRAFATGLQGASMCWQRARLTGLASATLTVQTTFAANGRVERLAIIGATEARHEPLQKCLAYVARRIRLPEPPGERVFVYAPVTFGRREI